MPSEQSNQSVRWQLALKLLECIDTLQFALKTKDWKGFSEITKEMKVILVTEREKK